MRARTTLFTALLLTAVSTSTAQAAAAQAAAPSAVVLPTQVRLNADGSVDITMKVRCSRNWTAFEWSIDVRQGTTYGNDWAGPLAGLITCNGKFQWVRTHVVGANGAYVRGPAAVQALVQLGDVAGGADSELEDRETIWLRPARGCPTHVP